MAFKCDIALLCEIVETKPCLWDKRNEHFKNKIIRERSWEEIYNFLDDEYDLKTSAEKKIIGEKITSKWVNIRDAFVRSLRSKSGQAAQKKYIYHDNLQFLLACQEPSDTTESSLLLDNSIAIEEEPSPGTAASYSPAASPQLKSKIKGTKRKFDFSVEEEILKELKKPNAEEKKCSFFSSFEEYITDMNEMEKLQLHMDILKSITNIKANRHQIEYVNFSE